MTNRYVFETCPNPDYCTIHLTTKVSDRFMSLQFEEHLPDFLSLLRSVITECRGVKNEVSIREYSISIQTGSAFNRLEVVNEVWSKICPLISTEYNLDENSWVRGKDIRSEIEATVCPKCQAIRDEMYAEFDDWKL